MHTLYIVYEKILTLSFLKFVFFQSFDILNFFWQWCNNSFQCQTNFSCSANTDIFLLFFFSQKKNERIYFSVWILLTKQRNLNRQNISQFTKCLTEKNNTFLFLLYIDCTDISYSDVWTSLMSSTHNHHDLNELDSN